MKDKYIFLDIDGVMTNMHDEVGSYFNHAPEKYGISKSNEDRLLGLCRSTNAKVIISSNWRRFEDNSFWTFNGMRYQNKISSLKNILGNYYSGTLPPIRHITKAEALILWIEDNDLSNEDFDFVIFDDDLRENFNSTHDYHISEHFIWTDYHFGITERDIQKAKEIINAS